MKLLRFSLFLTIICTTLIFSESTGKQSIVTTERAEKEFFVAAGFKILKTDMGTMGNIQGINGGMILNKHHQFSGEGYFKTREKSSIDDYSGKWENDHRLYSTLFASYQYKWIVKEWCNILFGMSGGFQITERDKNWNQEINLPVRLDDGVNYIDRDVQTRNIAESKYVSFGGPLLSLQLGYKSVFLDITTRMNVGYKKNFGYIALVDELYKGFKIEKDFKYNDVLQSPEGTFNKTSSVLIREKTVQPELIISLVILL